MSLKTHAIIELFGHTKMGGFVEEAPFGAGEMLQVTVPKTSTQPEFTKFINVKAVYAITPCDEVIAQQTAEHVKAAPLSTYGLETAVMANPDLVAKLRDGVKELPFPSTEIKITGCSACGQDHSIRFSKLSQPDNEGYTHWGVCSHTNQPVFLKATGELHGDEETDDDEDY